MSLLETGVLVSPVPVNIFKLFNEIVEGVREKL